jgi:outer membrane protein assembly factor BamB
VLKAGALGGIGGQLANKAVCSGAFGGTAWSGSTIYVPCVNGLYALSVSSTSIDVLWRARRPDLASPIVAAGAVWAIDNSGTLFALDPSSGAVVYSVSLGSAQHFSTPAATEGFVVVPAGRSVAAITTIR